MYIYILACEAIVFFITLHCTSQVPIHSSLQCLACMECQILNDLLLYLCVHVLAVYLVDHPLLYNELLCLKGNQRLKGVNVVYTL